MRRLVRVVERALHVALARLRGRGPAAPGVLEVALDASVARSSPRRLVTRALWLSLLNPKLTIFFFAFLPQFVDPAAGEPLAQLLSLSAVFMAMTFGVFVAYGAVAHAFRRRVIDSPRVQAWLRRGFAAAFAALGVRLALEER